MKEELTTAQHGEFTISVDTQRQHDAFALFQLVGAGMPVEQALTTLSLTLDQVRPFLAQWNQNALPAKQVILE